MEGHCPSLRIDEVTTTVVSGCSLQQAIPDAVRLALEFCADVNFEFNDILYQVRHSDLVSCVKKEGT